MTRNTRLKTQDRLIGLWAYGLISLLAYKPISLLLLCLASFSLLSALPSLAQTYQEDTQAEPEVYHESALRRFEIVFTISLPFTALHSYLAVRGVGMVRQRKISPELHRADWNAVGGLTILFSGFVAFWDYLHTRGEDISETMTTPREPTEPYSGYLTPGTRYSMSNIQYPELRLLSIRF
jgi:hypothetical protein